MCLVIGLSLKHFLCCVSFFISDRERLLFVENFCFIDVILGGGGGGVITRTLFPIKKHLP